MLKHLKPKSKNKEKELYDKYSDRMLLLCYWYIGNNMDAEEVMHNGFIKIFSNLQKFKERHEKSFEFWMRKIMVNECLMFLRKRVNFSLLSVDDINEAEISNGVVNDDLSLDEYLKIINQLPVGYRTVFNLYSIEGYSHKEIASSLKISENTSRTQLLKARKLLQKNLLKLDNLYA